MTSTEARPATQLRNSLGEGVLWDEREHRLLWVDIDEGTIYRGQLKSGGAVEIIHTIRLQATVGAVALAEDGGLLAAVGRGLAAISPDGVVTYSPDLLGDRAEVRWNDGAVDPQGRFLVGSLPLDDSTGQEHLIRVTAEGVLETLRTGVTLSNGIGFSPDWTTIYHIDSVPGTLSHHSYSPGPFNHDEPWQVLLYTFEGTPDGLAVDSEGNLWIAEWGAGKVRKHSPEGRHLQTVTVDAPQVTCPAFVGAALDQLAITTASKGLDDEAADSGKLFVAAQPGARGQATPRWAGDTRRPVWPECGGS